MESGVEEKKIFIYIINVFLTCSFCHMGEMLVPFLLSLGAEIPVDMGETSDEEEIWPVFCS